MCLSKIVLSSYIAMIFITSLAKKVMFLVALVCLFVQLSLCLSVSNITITQKVMN